MSLGSRIREAHLVMGAYGVHLIVDLVELATVDPNEVAANLARYDQDWRGSGVGCADARGCVEQARSRHHQRRPHFAAGAGVPIGHIACGLLVAGGDEPDTAVPLQAIQGVIDLHARQAENNLHPLPVQRLRQRLPASHLRHKPDSISLKCQLP